MKTKTLLSDRPDFRAQKKTPLFEKHIQLLHFEGSLTGNNNFIGILMCDIFSRGYSIDHCQGESSKEVKPFYPTHRVEHISLYWWFRSTVSCGVDKMKNNEINREKEWGKSEGKKEARRKKRDLVERLCGSWPTSFKHSPVFFHENKRQT